MSNEQSTQNRSVPTPAWFAQAFNQISNLHPKPEELPFRDTIAYRFAEPTIESAILLKLARYISGLNAGTLLLSNGFLQELCVIQRTLDEIHEDIYFLCLPHFGIDKTSAHEEYLAAFWEEEPEFYSYSAKQKNRHQVPRKKIRSYLSKVNPDNTVDHPAIATSGYLSRLLSGYVHAAGPQLLELFDPIETTFKLNGHRNSPLLADHAHDFENQLFRGVITVHVVARVFDAEAVAVEAFALHKHLEQFFHP